MTKQEYQQLGYALADLENHRELSGIEEGAPRLDKAMDRIKRMMAKYEEEHPR